MRTRRFAAPYRRCCSRRPSRDEIGLLAVAVGLALVMVCHTMLPDVGGLGTLLDSAAPWLGLLVPALAVPAVVRRHAYAMVGMLVPTMVWAVLFGPAMVSSASGEPGDLRALSQNLYAGNADPAATATGLARTGADIIGTQEMTGRTRTTVNSVLRGDHPYHAAKGTVGVWSRFPINAAEPVDLGLDWTRALRAEIRTPRGPVVVYVAHLPSLRPGLIEQRNGGLAELAGAVRSDPATRVLVLADLNTASTDRAMRLLRPVVRSAQSAAGSGQGFTWPASFPVARVDHVLYRGMRATRASTVSTQGSDHLAVEADFDQNRATHRRCQFTGRDEPPVPPR